MYTSYYYGPYFHTGAGIVRQHITSGLMRDKEYSVIGNIGIESKTIQSNEVLLSELECMISNLRGGKTWGQGTRLGCHQTRHQL